MRSWPGPRAANGEARDDGESTMATLEDVSVSELGRWGGRGEAGTTPNEWGNAPSLAQEYPIERRVPEGTTQHHRWRPA
jgi:hypothetical protein